MLVTVRDGVLVHQSDFCQSNTIVVRGADAALLVDPGIRSDELACLCDDLSAVGWRVTAGFSTHPHWDHLLWDARLGTVPRLGTHGCATTIQRRMAAPTWASTLAAVLPPDLADEVPLELLGLIDGLPEGAALLPWDGPRTRVVEHRAHAPGHAALLVDELGVLIAGDMLSDVLIPLLDMTADEPVEEYLDGLQQLERVLDDVDVVVPGHGSVGHGAELHARVAQDRAYVSALGEGRVPEDPRVGASAPFRWMSDVHERQLKQLADRRDARG